MSGKKQDRKLLASSQKWEPQAIATKYKIPVSLVREVAKIAGKNGKPTRSQKKVYAALEELGHRVGGVKNDLPEDTLPPTLPEGDVFVNG